MKLPSVSNHEADKSLRSLNGSTVIEVNRIDRMCKGILMNDRSCQIPLDGGLTDAEIKLLAAVVKQPMQSSTSYIKLAGISPNTLSKIRSNLIEQEYIRQHTVSSTRGRPAQLWEATKKAITLINKLEENHAG